MFDLDGEVDRWLAETVLAEPDLAPHQEEIADHLINQATDLIAGGLAPKDALATAIDELGATAAMAGEYRKRGTIGCYLRFVLSADREPTRVEHLAIAAVWLVFSLCWAAVMIVIDGSSEWATIGWLITTYLPLTALGAAMNRRTEGQNDCGKSRLRRILRRL